MAKQPQRSHQQSNSTNQHKSKKFDFVEVDFELLNWRSAAPPPTNHSQTKLKFVLFIHWWRWAGQPAAQSKTNQQFSSIIVDLLWFRYFYNTFLIPQFNFIQQMKSNSAMKKEISFWISGIDGMKLNGMVAGPFNWLIPSIKLTGSWL